MKIDLLCCIISIFSAGVGFHSIYIGTGDWESGLLVGLGVANAVLWVARERFIQ